MPFFISSVNPRGSQYTITTESGANHSDKVYNGRAAAEKALAKLSAPPAPKKAPAKKKKDK